MALRGFIYVMTLALLASTPAAAKDEEKIAGIRISYADKKIIQSYLRDNYRAKCPPGLAKKNPDCVPPGKTRKYARGNVLAADARPHALPTDIAAMVHPIKGYHYVQVQHEVLLISETTNQVIDTVTMFSIANDPRN